MGTSDRSGAFIKALHRGAPVLLFSLLFISCVSGKAGYPAGWSPRVETAPADFSGRYNEALIHLLSGAPLREPDSGQCTYAFILNVKEIKYKRDCPQHSDPDNIEFMPITVGGYELKLKQIDEGLQIVYKPLSIAGNPVAGYQKEYVILSKAKDGSLIVEKVGKVYGLAFMIFPVAASEHLWYRFYDGKVEIFQ